MRLQISLIGPGKSQFGYAYWEESIELVDDGSWLYPVDSGGSITISSVSAVAGFMCPETSAAGALTMLADPNYIFAEA